MAFDSISETGETALTAQLINATAAGEKEMAGCTGNPVSKTGQQGSERQYGADGVQPERRGALSDGL